MASVFFILLVLVSLKFKLFNFDRSETLDITHLFQYTINFWSWISHVVSLINIIFKLDIEGLVSLLTSWLDIRQGRIYLWMLEFIMLVQWSFRSIWLSTASNSALIKSFNFMSISSKSFCFLISFKRTKTFLILIFTKSMFKMIFLFNQFFDLICKCYIS